MMSDSSVSATARARLGRIARLRMLLVRAALAAFSVMTVAVADGSSLGCATRMPVDTLALELDHALGGVWNALVGCRASSPQNVSRMSLSYRYRPTI